MCFSSNGHKCHRAERNAFYDLSAMSLSQLLTNSGASRLGEPATLWLAAFWSLVGRWVGLLSQSQCDHQSPALPAACAGFVLWIRFQLIRVSAMLPARGLGGGWRRDGPAQWLKSWLTSDFVRAVCHFGAPPRHEQVAASATPAPRRLT